MAEYIDKEKMLKYLEENNTADEWIVGQYNADWIYSFIESQPTADAEEVKHGRIIETLENGKMKRVFSCCGTDFTQLTTRITPIYCPYCGAKMDGKQVSE